MQEKKQVRFLQYVNENNICFTDELKEAKVEKDTLILTFITNNGEENVRVKIQDFPTHLNEVQEKREVALLEFLNNKENEKRKTKDSIL